KGLAAASIRQYEEAVAALVEYSRSVDLGLQVLLRHRPGALVQLSRLPARRPGLVVIGSDQGLCGGFNERVSAFFLERRAAMGPDADGRPLVVVGTRAAGRIEDAGVPIA